MASYILYVMYLKGSILLYIKHFNALFSNQMPCSARVLFAFKKRVLKHRQPYNEQIHFTVLVHYTAAFNLKTRDTMNLHTMYLEALTVYDKEIKIVTIIKPFLFILWLYNNRKLGLYDRSNYLKVLEKGTAEQR